MKESKNLTTYNKDELSMLIKEYNYDQELNRLKDILDYLKSNYLYLPVSIKISKQKLLKIPKDDIILIVNDLHNNLKTGTFPIYSRNNVENSQYFVELSIYDAFILMNKFKEIKTITINPNYDDQLIIDKAIINYLKNRR